MAIDFELPVQVSHLWHRRWWRLLRLRAIVPGGSERPFWPLARAGVELQVRSRAASTSDVPVLFSSVPSVIIPLMLFEIPHHELSDAEIAAILRDIIAGAGRFPRNIEACIASICAEHLVDGLRLAGLIVIRPVPKRLAE